MRRLRRSAGNHADRRSFSWRNHPLNSIRTSPHESHQALASSLARLWPHREHESNALKSFLCMIGLHRWLQLDLVQFAPGHDVQFCFWCSKMRVDGIEYDP